MKVSTRSKDEVGRAEEGRMGDSVIEGKGLQQGVAVVVGKASTFYVCLCIFLMFCLFVLVN